MADQKTVSWEVFEKDVKEAYVRQDGKEYKGFVPIEEGTAKALLQKVGDYVLFYNNHIHPASALHVIKNLPGVRPTNLDVGALTDIGVIAKFLEMAEKDHVYARHLIPNLCRAASLYVPQDSHRYRLLADYGKATNEVSREAQDSEGKDFTEAEKTKIDNFVKKGGVEAVLRELSSAAKGCEKKFTRSWFDAWRKYIAVRLQVELNCRTHDIYELRRVRVSACYVVAVAKGVGGSGFHHRLDHGRCRAGYCQVQRGHVREGG